MDIQWDALKYMRKPKASPVGVQKSQKREAVGYQS